MCKMIGKLGQALGYARKIGQGINTARKIGSFANQALGGRLTANPLGAKLNDFSKRAESIVGNVTKGLETAQNWENTLRRL